MYLSSENFIIDRKLKIEKEYSCDMRTRTITNYL